MKYKKILLMLVWSVLLTGACVLLYLINLHKKNQVCEAIQIDIKNSDVVRFIDSALVMSYINARNILGQTIVNIDAGQIELLLENNPHVRNAEVYKDVTGTVYIKIWQRIPVMRVINTNHESYYVDEENIKIPVSENYTARVLVCRGNIDEKCTKCDTINSNMLKTCSGIAQYVHNSNFWMSAIEEIFVTAENEIFLVHKMGDAKIVFGDATDIENKFDRLFAFYKQALPKTGWEKYSRIDLSFKNQIVAKKKG